MESLEKIEEDKWKLDNYYQSIIWNNKGLENQNDNINMYSQIESGELLEENEDSVGN